MLQDYKMKDGDWVIYMVSAKKASAPVPAPAPAAAPVPVANAPESTETLATGAAAGQTASSAARSPASAEDFTSGADRELAIQYMLELGFPRADIDAAMRAAFNNPHRAVEYLLSEIPASPRAPASSPSETSAANTALERPEAAATEAPAERNAEVSHQNMFDEAAAALSGGAAPGGDAALDSEMALLRDSIISNPELLQPLLQRIAESNPQVAQLIAQDPEGFVNRFLDNEFDIEDGDEEAEDLEGDASHDGAITVQFTEQDQNAVNRLCELGFERNLVIQVYMACDKNEEVAADILFRDT